MRPDRAVVLPVRHPRAAPVHMFAPSAVAPRSRLIFAQQAVPNFRCRATAIASELTVGTVVCSAALVKTVPLVRVKLPPVTKVHHAGI